MMTVAIMQPCFMPYAGYFRLFAAADLFVVYDCVQFPRRGLVHRNRLPDYLDRSKWLTLPILKAPQKTLIRNLGFAEDPAVRLAAQFSKFPSLVCAEKKNHQLMGALNEMTANPVDYLVSLLKTVCETLGFSFKVKYSSEFNIDPALKGQDRILAILKHVGATGYVNSPGGRHLYDDSSFDKIGVDIRFLERYKGPYWSLLHRLLTESPKVIADEIRYQV